MHSECFESFLSVHGLKCGNLPNRAFPLRHNCGEPRGSQSHMEEVRWSQRQDTNILFSLFVQPIWSDSPFPVFNRVSTQVHSHFPNPDFCKCCQQRHLHFCVPVSNAVIGSVRALRHWHLLPRSSTFRCLCLHPPPPILLAL